MTSDVAVCLPTFHYITPNLLICRRKVSFQRRYSLITVQIWQFGGNLFGNLARIWPPKSEQFDAGAAAFFDLFGGPERGLDFSDVGFLQQVHAEAALAYASAD